MTFKINAGSNKLQSQAFKCPFCLILQTNVPLNEVENEKKKEKRNEIGAVSMKISSPLILYLLFIACMLNTDFLNSNIFHEKNRTTFILIRKVGVLRNLTVYVLSLCLLSESVSKGPKLETLDFAFYIGSTPTAFTFRFVYTFISLSFWWLCPWNRTMLYVIYYVCINIIWPNHIYVACMIPIYYVTIYYINSNTSFRFLRFACSLSLIIPLLVFNYHWTFSKYILNYKM